jgi:hypothetical protein
MFPRMSRKKKKLYKKGLLMWGLLVNKDYTKKRLKLFTIE